jgi:proteasome accessory factor C
MSGTAGERLARMLAVVPWLVAHDGVTVDECAAHFGVTPEQLERDLWLLVVCGVPGYGPDQLVDIDFWDDGVIHVLDPQTLGRPMRLTHEEALSLLVALRMLAQLPGVDDRDAVVTAAAKLERIASEGGSDRFITVQVRVPPSVTEAVDTAIALGSDLHITYASATKDEVTSRTVQPRRLFSIDGVSYLEAHCLSAEALRTFRLDRVLDATVTEPTAPRRERIEPAPTAPASVTPLPTGPTAVLALSTAARWIVDVHQATVLDEEASDGWALVRVPLHSLDWAVRLVLMLRGEARVVEPAELVEAVAAAAASALEAYPY